MAEAKAVEKTETKATTKTKATSKTKAAPKTKAASKAKATSKTKAAPKDFIITTAAMVENLTKTKAVNTAKKLVDEFESTFFKLGGVLSVIQAKNYWSEVTGPDGEPYASFRAFMEAEYNMPYRRGMYAIQIYNNLVESGVSWDAVKDLGWTKLKEISGLITPDNVDEWVARAKSMTVLQLIDYIKAESKPTKKKADKKPPSVTTITFKVHPDQKDTIRMAIDKAKEDSDTEFDSVALEYICMAYLEGKVGKVKKVEKPLAEVLKETTAEELFTCIDKEGLYEEYDITVVEK